MKKFALLFCSFSISVLGYSQNIVLKSLNGYSQIQAITMIKHFKDMNAKPSSPLATSVWFTSAFIKALNKLLEDENTNPPIAGMGPTDGIRIYFATDVNNVNTVIIVSTYATGIKDPETGLEYHEDYYEHSSTEDLFNLKDTNGNTIVVSGSVCSTNNCSGAALYVSCTTCKPDNCPEGPHYLTRAQCENMAQAFGKFKVNSTSEWFDKELINAFANENPATGFDGVRIYFGRHPFNDQSRYPGKDAFVLVTTQTITNSNPALTQQDYFYCTTTNQYFQKKLGPSEKLIEYPLNGSDNGELCPDNCNIP